jgi:uncharacterized protein (TIGR03435 family)
MRAGIHGSINVGAVIVHRILGSAAVLLILTTLQVRSQSLDQPKADSMTDSNPKQLSWDVVSVKPHKAADGVSSWMRTGPAGFSADVTVRSLVMTAYNLIMLEQISGLPGWAENENYEVQGKLDSESTEAFKKLSRNNQASQRSLLMQALLADRFKLRLHHDLRELPVYNLVIARSGLKMKEASSSKDESWSMGLGSITSKGMPIASLVASLSNPVGRMIIDKTGLTGKYEINLTFSWNDEPGDASPSIFTALQDELGLRLEPAKAPVDVVVIDHLERPSEN